MQDQKFPVINDDERNYMSTQTIILLVSIVYLIMMLSVGLWANTKMKSSKDFLVAGQSLGFFVMAIASFYGSPDSSVG